MPLPWGRVVLGGSRGGDTVQVAGLRGRQGRGHVRPEPPYQVRRLQGGVRRGGPRTHTNRVRRFLAKDRSGHRKGRLHPLHGGIGIVQEVPGTVFAVRQIGISCTAEGINLRRARGRQVPHPGGGEYDGRRRLSEDDDRRAGQDGEVFRLSQSFRDSACEVKQRADQDPSRRSRP